MSLPARRRAVLGATIGTVVEGFDWAIYAGFAVLVAPRLFFPDSAPEVAIAAAIATHGAAFVARPLGGALFGHLGDRLGRNRVLAWTLALMGAATLAIAVLPGYATLGVLAPVLLVGLRLVQGLSLGGEWGGATLLAVEHAPEDGGRGRRGRRGLYGSSIHAGWVAGSVIASSALLLISQLPDDAFLTWGWRVAFAAGGALAFVGVVIRGKINETPEFTRSREQGQLVRRPVAEALRRYPRQIALVAATYIAGGSTFYCAIIFGQSYGLSVLGFDRTEMTTVNLVVSVVMVITIPLWGVLADTIGYRRVVLIGLAAVAVMLPPWILLFSTGELGWALLGYGLLAVALAGAWGPLGALFAQVFPTEMRTSGISLGYQIGTVFGGALPPLIATAILAGTGDITWVIVYLAGTVVVSAVAAWMLRTPPASPPRAEDPALPGAATPAAPDDSEGTLVPAGPGSDGRDV